MKKKIKYFLVGVIPLILVSFFVYNSFNDTRKINKILESKSYSYLPKEAKNYIKEVYEDTGEVVLTEKNKEPDVPYLNPEYIEYLSLSDGEKKDINIIPQSYIVNYSGKYNEKTFDSYYSLDDVDGKQFVTPTKNQQSTGLCWAFTSVEQAESYSLIKNNQSYSSQSELFSVRQMDYATSADGINNFENSLSYRPLTEGGNYSYASLIMIRGLSLVDDSYMPFSTDKTKKELHEVLNYSKSKYEVDSTINMPVLTKTSNEEDRLNYNNTIKENIINNGGLYVGTGSPQAGCGFKNTDGTYAIHDNSSCVGSSGHAMQIIGWDDNYAYSYCETNSKHYSVKENNTCESGTLHTGKGAWILRNSWGETNDYNRVYLTYNSYSMEIGAITSMSKMDQRTWDNAYNSDFWHIGASNVKNENLKVAKAIDTTEKIEKIKFVATSMNSKYSISIVDGNNEYENIKTVETSYPGVYTIDLSDENLVMNESQYTVSISGEDKSYIEAGTIHVFTSNVDKTPIIDTEFIDNRNVINRTASSIKYNIFSDTKNINSDEEITYKLLKNDIDYSSYILSTLNNIVAFNNVNSTIEIDNSIISGKYTLRVLYNDFYFDTSIDIQTLNSNPLEGSGTQYNPYLIYTEEDLKQINNDLNAYYLLKNDITLTDNWIPIGTYGNPFSGTFDGDNHTIKELTIINSNDSAVGLFGYVAVKDKHLNIKNIKLENANVSNNGDAGILVGKIIYGLQEISYPTITIDSVYLINGSVISYSGNAGSLIASVDVYTKSFNTTCLDVNNVYSSATISGKHSAGLIGFINDKYYSASGVMLRLEMTNIQNAGLIDESIVDLEYNSNNNVSFVIGGVFGSASIKLKNYIITSCFSPDYSFPFMYDNGNSSYSSNDKNYIVGNYSKDGDTQITLQYGFVSSRMEKEDLMSALLPDYYKDWENFNTYWKMEEVNSIKRLPVLKEIEYDYTDDVSNISMNLYDEFSLKEHLGIDYLNIFSYISDFNDNNIVYDKDEIKPIFIDGTHPHEVRFIVNKIFQSYDIGTSSFNYINRHDGYIKNILINVTAEIKGNPIITFYKDNSQDAESYNQTVSKNVQFNLDKNNFEKKHYKFKGWGVSTNLYNNSIKYADQELIESGIDHDIKLFAKWELIWYKIKFDMNGKQSQKADISINVTNEAKTFGSPSSVNDYAFVEWNTKADGSGISYSKDDTVNLDNIEFDNDNQITLYAIWREKSYSITFNSNGGTGTMNNQQYPYDTVSKINPNLFTNIGYSFKNWNTKADGSGTSYNDGQEIALQSNLTLYAQWEENPMYNITKYSLNNEYIDLIDINTTLDDFKTNIELNPLYTLDIDYKNINSKSIIYTGGKTKIYKNSILKKEFINVVRGDVNGDAKLSYLDYVKVYNHIKENGLTGAYLKAADMSQDNKITFMDYVKIYNKINELKGVN